MHYLIVMLNKFCAFRIVMVMLFQCIYLHQCLYLPSGAVLTVEVRKVNYEL